MTTPALDRFISQAHALSTAQATPADCVEALGQRVVNLHLYGRAMSNFNVYDVAAGTRRRIEGVHNPS